MQVKKLLLPLYIYIYIRTDITVLINIINKKEKLNIVKRKKRKLKKIVSEWVQLFFYITPPPHRAHGG